MHTRDTDPEKIMEPFDFEHMMAYIRRNIGYLRECPGHKFVSVAFRGAMYKCAKCGGEVEGYNFDLYVQGMRDGVNKLRAEVKTQTSSDNESNFGEFHDTKNILPKADAA